MKHFELPPNIQIETNVIINNRWGQLYGLSKEATDQIIQFLFLTNAGGAIAVLSFLGTSETVRLLATPKIALGLFSLGVILIGILRTLRFHYMEGLFKEWQKDVARYYSDGLDREDLFSGDEQRTKSRLRLISYGVGYLSFGCFISGGLIGFCSFIPYGVWQA